MTKIDLMVAQQPEFPEFCQNNDGKLVSEANYFNHTRCCNPAGQQLHALGQEHVCKGVNKRCEAESDCLIRCRAKVKASPASSPGIIACIPSADQERRLQGQAPNQLGN